MKKEIRFIDLFLSKRKTLFLSISLGLSLFFISCDQTKPYNNKVPVYVTGTSTRVRVGCFPVAVGQIMAYHKYPKSYNWTLLTAQEKITSSHAGSNEVCRLLYGIALACQTEYSTAKPAGAGTTYSNTYISGINKMGYSAKEIYFGTSGGSIPVIKEEIRVNNSPVIYCGQSAKGGHGWVVDGVMTMERWTYISAFPAQGNIHYIATVHPEASYIAIGVGEVNQMAGFII